MRNDILVKETEMIWNKLWHFDWKIRQCWPILACNL